MTSRRVTSSSFVRRHRGLLLLLVVVVVVVVARGIFFETFTVPSGSMEPTLMPGDRIVVWKIGEEHLHHGEIIVFNGTDVFTNGTAPSSPNALVAGLRRAGDAIGIRTGQADYVKRIIGLPGDTVSVDPHGVLRIDGNVAKEPYLPAGMSASRMPFRVRVPAGHLFVMGDNRPVSDDSRGYLGSPGGGMVPVSEVIGKVVLRYWPIGSWGRLRS